MSEDLVFDHEQVSEHGWEIYEGTPLDVRVVIAGIPRAVKDGFRLEEVPWSRFGHAYGSGQDVPEQLEGLRSPDSESAEWALRRLWGSVVHQGTVGSVAPLTVPFLVRLAADPSVHHRAQLLGLAAAAARREHWGFGTRDTFLLVTPREEFCDNNGYAMHWSIEASRDAVTADCDLVLGLLHDPDPEIRASACYTLATASGETDSIAVALRAVLAIEQNPIVRASLVLAIAELGREHAESQAATWAEALRTDSAQSADVRVIAALAWLCLTDVPVPDELRTTLDVLLTDDLAGVLNRVAWIKHVDDADGLARTLGQMLDGAQPGVPWEDPWD
ncbi:hypothetical protein ACWGVR_12875 [Streptomyces xanthophaeus]